MCLQRGGGVVPLTEGRDQFIGKEEEEKKEKRGGRKKRGGMQ